MTFDPPRAVLRSVVARALVEDLGALGDITSAAVVAGDTQATAHFVARQGGVVAGTAAATEVFHQVENGLSPTWTCRDGEAVQPGSALGRVSGRLRSILAAERVALNFLTHCSGVATLTRQYVHAVAATGSRARIRDSRKTLPGLRALEKAAVRAGGGFNHRDSLSDAVLIKDNHLHGVGVVAAVEAAREHWPGRVVEVECDTIDQVGEAVAANADIVLLDNMSLAEVRAAVELSAEAVELEVSGGVTLDTVADLAECGVHYIAVGAITHSAPALDIGLDIGD